MKKLFLILLFIKLIKINSAIEIQYPGKILNSYKSQEKVKIANAIQKNIDNYFQKIINPKTTEKDALLSASAMSRYCGKEYYYQQSNLDERIIKANHKNDNLCLSDNSILFYFITKKITAIKHKIKNLYSNLNNFLESAYLLLFVTNILHGQNTRESFPPEYTNEKFKNYTIVELLLNKKKQFQSFNNKVFDKIAEDILLHTFIFNGTDPVEKDRASNRIEYFSDRQPILLMIETHKKTDFSTYDTLNTFGEMSPSRDIYQKILFNPIISHQKTEGGENPQGRYQMSHRNLPEKPAIHVEYLLAIPLNKDNMTTYYVFKKDNTFIKLKNYIREINENNMFTITTLPTERINWLLS